MGTKIIVKVEYEDYIELNDKFYTYFHRIADPKCEDGFTNMIEEKLRKFEQLSMLDRQVLLLELEELGVLHRYTYPKVESKILPSDYTHKGFILKVVRDE